jgi:hypothetical protein
MIRNLVIAALAVLVCVAFSSATDRSPDAEFTVRQSSHSGLLISNGAFRTNFDNGCGIFFSSDEEALDAVAVIRTNFLYAATYDDICSDDRGSSWRNYSTILVHPAGKTFDYFRLSTGGYYTLVEGDSICSLYGIPTDITLTNGRILVLVNFCLSDANNDDRIVLSTNTRLDISLDNPDFASYAARYMRFLEYLMEHFEKYLDRD